MPKFTDICSSPTDLYGNTIPTFRTTVMFIRLIDSSKSINIECHPKKQLINIVKGGDVYQDYPKKDIKLFKLPYSGLWVQNNSFIDKNYNTFILKSIGIHPIGSSFGVSRLHGAEEIVYKPIPFNRKILMTILNLPADERYDILQNSQLTLYFSGEEDIAYPELTDTPTNPIIILNDDKDYGMIYNPDGSTYEGEFNDGKENGYGSLISPNYSYIGEFKNGLFNGEGEKTGKTYKYEGRFVDGKYNGKGKLTRFHYGKVFEEYDGDFKDNKLNGKGIYKYSNGDIYEGEFKHDKKNGYGIYKYKCGNVYKGYFIDGLANGKGIFIYETGDIYEGEFEDDMRHGKGIFKYENGDIYEGEFKHGVSYGFGTYKYANGDVYEGDFINGSANGKGIRKYNNGDIYEGEFEDDKKHGFGTYKYTNGDIYTGEYKNDVINGTGKMINKERKVIYEGKWIDGKPAGKDEVKDEKEGKEEERAFKFKFK
jgi:hypothetical protein